MNMMDFKNRNKIYTAPASMPECLPLPVYQRSDEDPLIISKWELQNEDEVLALLLNRSVYIGINALRQPPVWITTLSPFVDGDELDDEETARNQMEALIDEKIETFLQQAKSLEYKSNEVKFRAFLKFCLGMEGK